MSQELDEEANEHTRQHVHHHTCSNLFGCGDEKGIGILREDIKERAFNNRASDRLLHMDEIDQANLEGYLSARGRRRRKFLQASSFMGALAAVGPWFGKLARADEAGKPATAHQGEGRMHVVPSTKETVQLGVYDTNLPPILTIDSGELDQLSRHLVPLSQRVAAGRVDRHVGEAANGQSWKGAAVDYRADRR